MPIDSSEHLKHSFEYLRHLTALSAGAIVLQVGFLEKLFPDPKYKALVAISIVSFTGAIVSSVITQWGLLSFLGHKSVEKGLKTGCFVILMWLGFLVGLLTAVSFALINLFLKV
jgi:uncharacterized membrane protein